MPTPRTGESQKDFLSRCVPMVIKEGKHQQQAVAQCISMYKQAKNKRISKSRKKRRTPPRRSK